MSLKYLNISSNLNLKTVHVYMIDALHAIAARAIRKPPKLKRVEDFL